MAHASAAAWTTLIITLGAAFVLPSFCDDLLPAGLECGTRVKALSDDFVVGVAQTGDFGVVVRLSETRLKSPGGLVDASLYAFRWSKGSVTECNARRGSARTYAGDWHTYRWRQQQLGDKSKCSQKVQVVEAAPELTVGTRVQGKGGEIGVIDRLSNYRSLTSNSGVGVTWRSGRTSLFSYCSAWVTEIKVVPPIPCTLGDGNKCATCREQLDRTDKDQCASCNPGYWLYGSMCKACPSSCATCSRETTTPKGICKGTRWGPPWPYDFTRYCKLRPNTQKCGACEGSAHLHDGICCPSKTYFHDGRCLQIGSVDPGEPCKVEVFQHAGFRGWRAAFGVGNYNVDEFVERGATNNEIGSIKVVGSGCIAEFYQHGHFTGRKAGFRDGYYDGKVHIPVHSTSPLKVYMVKGSPCKSRWPLVGERIISDGWTTFCPANTKSKPPFHDESSSCRYNNDGDKRLALRHGEVATVVEVAAGGTPWRAPWRFRFSNHDGIESWWKSPEGLTYAAGAIIDIPIDNEAARQTVSLKGGGKLGRYCTDYGNGVRCIQTWKQGWEKFEVWNAGGGKIALKGGKDGRYCADEGEDGIKCNRDKVDTWEEFEVQVVGGNRLSLKGGQFKRYCADEGHQGVKCTREAIGAWEKFAVEVVHLPRGGRRLSGTQNGTDLHNNSSADDDAGLPILV